MPYDALAVANYFLDLASRQQKTLSAMKIQKLVYYAHGWNLAITDEPLIDEVVQAWEYGPVIPSVYHAFKKFGSGPIKEKARELRIVDEGDESFFDTPMVPDSDTMTVALLGTIWEAYGDLSAVQLSNLTHQSDSPWHQTYIANMGRKGVGIPDDLIRNDFVNHESRP